MAGRTVSWTTAAQICRVALVDAKTTGIDAAFGFFYVVAGFYLSGSHLHRAVHLAVWPFIWLSFVLGYLILRFCGPETEDNTAMFYANLPRRRAITYLGHAAWLAAYALAMEVIIVVGIMLRLGAARPDQPVIASPYMFFLPYLAIAFFMWLVYGRPLGRFIGWWIYTLPFAAATLFGLVSLNIWDAGLRDSIEVRSSVTLWQNLWPVLLLALLTALFLLHGSIRWSRTQIGETS